VIMNYDKNLSFADLTIEGIMMGQTGENLAVINGNVVKKNTSLGQFIVARITADKVVLKDGQQQFELKLKKEVIE